MKFIMTCRYNNITVPFFETVTIIVEQYIFLYIIILLAQYYFIPNNKYIYFYLQVGDGGIILLSGAAVDESFTDEDDEIMRSLESPPSPCDVTFINDNILIDGKSSLSQKTKRSKVCIFIILLFNYFIKLLHVLIGIRYKLRFLIGIYKKQVHKRKNVQVSKNL